MPNTYSALYSHIVFATKHRAPVLSAEIRRDLYPYFGGICRNIRCTLLAVGGVEDHVHLLLRRHPSVCESDAMRDVKANSSRMLKKHLPEFCWQDGGGAFSVGPQDTAKVERYNARQEHHRRHLTFEEEYLGFLRRCGVGFDRRHVLG